MQNLKSLLVIFVALCVFSACEKEEKADLLIPSKYDGSTFATNTTKQATLRNQLDQLVTEVKKGRTAGTKVTFDALNAWYTGGNPSLKSITSVYYDSRLLGTDGWLAELAKASGTMYTPSAPNGGQGGVYGAYLFDENGLELEQMIEKGLFGAALFNHALTLAKGPITSATVDQLISIYGAHPDFPNTYIAAKASNPDKYLANYAARRDKNDGKGLYTSIRDNFIKLQAAVKAGNDYQQEQDEALKAILENWEKVNAATVINYCHSVISVMSSTNPNDTQKSGALHSYGEAVGFIHGWRTISSKIITDAQIDEILTLLNAVPGANPTSYKFLTSPETELSKLLQVISKLKSIYKFTDQEVEDFKKNWVTEQAR
jgi:hypothetical protein